MIDVIAKEIALFLWESDQIDYLSSLSLDNIQEKSNYEVLQDVFKQLFGIDVELKKRIENEKYDIPFAIEKITVEIVRNGKKIKTEDIPMGIKKNMKEFIKKVKNR